MSRSDIPFLLMAVAFVMMAWLAYPGHNRRAQQLPPKVTVELSPEVRYAIQEETRRQMIEHRKQMTRPILPMVAPDPRTKVKR